MKNFIRLTAVFFLLASLTALPVTASAASPGASIKVGVVLPMTGNNAFDGRLTLEGIQLATDEINGKGGIAGKTKIELVIMDSRGIPADAVSVMEKLVNVEKVSAVLGDFGSSCTLAMAPVAQREETPLITPISMAPKVTKQGHSFVFRTADNSEINARAFVQMATDDLKIKKWAFIGVNDDYGRGSVEAFTPQVTQKDGKVVYSEYYEHGENDYYTLLTKLKSTDAEGLCLFGQVQDLSRLINQIAELGLDKKLKVMDPTSGLLSQQFLDLTKGRAAGLIGSNTFVDVLDTPKAKAFVTAYKAKHGYGPQKYGNAGYLATYILSEAIARAGSDDRKAIRDALAKTDFEGTTGRVTFDKNNQLIQPEWLISIKQDSTFAIIGGPVIVSTE